MPILRVCNRVGDTSKKYDYLLTVRVREFIHQLFRSIPFINYYSFSLVWPEVHINIQERSLDQRVFALLVLD